MSYSPIEHLAKTVALSKFEWREVWLGMLTARFDASGTDKNTPHMIMAGYLATADQWIAFDKAWLGRLKDDGILYFRRSECDSNEGKFAGWDNQDTRKDKLLRDLIKIIADNTTYKTGCIVENRILKTTREIEEQFHLHAYAFTGIVSVSECLKWRERKQINQPIEWIFERGDDGANELRKVMDIFGTSDPIFREKIERRDRKGNLLLAFTGLQASDFLAWEISSALNRKKHSDYLESLDKQPGDPAGYHVESIEELSVLLKQVATDNEFAAKIEEKQDKQFRRK